MISTQKKFFLTFLIIVKIDFFNSQILLIFETRYLRQFCFTKDYRIIRSSFSNFINLLIFDELIYATIIRVIAILNQIYRYLIQKNQDISKQSQEYLIKYY